VEIQQTVFACILLLCLTPSTFIVYLIAFVFFNSPSLSSPSNILQPITYILVPLTALENFGSLTPKFHSEERKENEKKMRKPRKEQSSIEEVGSQEDEKLISPE
jgi:hypothetical protein